MVKRQTTTKLNIYRRHASTCPIKKPRTLDACECPLWMHGKLRGKFIRKSLDTRNLPYAIMRRDEMVTNHDDDPTPDGPKGGLQIVGAKPKGDISVEASIKDFLAFKAKRATNTVVAYESSTAHFGSYLEAANVVLLRELDRVHIASYLAEFAKTRTSATVQSRLTRLRVWLNYCKRERRWIDYSPAESRDLNYTRKGKTAMPSELRLPLTDEEIARVFAAVKKLRKKNRPRAYALLLVLLYTGMRISDATFLERDCIDLQNNLCYWVIKTGKELPCSIELQSQVMDALNALPKTRTYFFQPDRDDDYKDARRALRTGGKFDKAMPGYRARVDNAAMLISRVMKIAGLTGRCHRFRDTFAVKMLTGNEHGCADLFTVCQFLAHSDVKITQDHYIKFVPGYRERIAQRTRVLAYQFPLAG